MKNLNVFCIVFVFFSLFSAKAYSQGNFSIHAGYSIPDCIWGYEPLEIITKSLPKVGFNIGAEYAYPLKVKGLDIFIAADFFNNGVSEGVKNRILEILDHTSNRVLNIKDTYKYLNIPVFAGVNYTFNITKLLSIYGELGVGADFLKITSMDVLDKDIVFLKYSYDLSIRPAYKIGTGVVIDNKYLLSFHHFGSGEKRITGSIYYPMTPSIPPSGAGGEELKISIFTISVGYKF